MPRRHSAHMASHLPQPLLQALPLRFHPQRLLPPRAAVQCLQMCLHPVLPAWLLLLVLQQAVQLLQQALHHPAGHLLVSAALPRAAVQLLKVAPAVLFLLVAAALLLKVAAAALLQWVAAAAVLLLLMAAAGLLAVPSRRGRRHMRAGCTRSGAGRTSCARRSRWSRA